MPGRGRGRGRGAAPSSQQPFAAAAGTAARSTPSASGFSQGRGPGRGRGQGGLSSGSRVKPWLPGASGIGRGTALGGGGPLTETRDGPSAKDDEEDALQDRIVSSAFQAYDTALARNVSGDSGGTAMDSARQQVEETLLGALTSSCLVCLDDIEATNPVWCCEQCHCMFHLPCIQKWIRQGVAPASAQALSDELFPDRERPWLCPKCRFEYPQAQFPSKYTCFCGKVPDPSFDPWIAPHSCGDMCGKRLKTDCGHTCMLLCHPGGCPPCPQTVRDAPCYCGKARQSRRCGNKNFSCGKPCGKVLSCGVHRCSEPCHTGDCSPCSQTSVQSCSCGRNSKRVACASPPWNCSEPCNKPLACGHHNCSQVCHSGSCAPCPGVLPRTCFCGKQEMTLPCTEEVSSCGDTCGKALDCGVHTCMERCHRGSCPSCLASVTKTCPCGGTTKTLACSAPIKCEKRCNNRRNCDRHACRKKCCDGNCPPCEEECGRKLPCGNHRCQGRCHSGPCYPCPLTVTVTCRCSLTKITVPCGREKTTKPPRCKHPCMLPAYCRHPQQQPHRCHFGDCPGCEQVCGQVVGPCGHTCLAKCHDERPKAAAPLTKTAKKKKSAPTTPSTPVVTPCPPCATPVLRSCIGGHDPQPRPCHQTEAFACNCDCNRPLACLRHNCQRPCHAPDKEVVWSDFDVESPDPVFCGECTLPCDQPRPEGCSHVCSIQQCHPDDCPPCNELVHVVCHCGSLTLNFACSKLRALAPDELENNRSCPGKCPKQLACGHRCTKDCHPGPCSDASLCKKKIAVRCPCKHKKSELRCAEHQALKGGAALACDDDCAAAQHEADQQARELERQRSEQEERDRQVHKDLAQVTLAVAESRTVFRLLAQPVSCRRLHVLVLPFQAAAEKWAPKVRRGRKNKRQTTEEGVSSRVRPTSLLLQWLVWMFADHAGYLRLCFLFFWFCTVSWSVGFSLALYGFMALTFTNGSVCPC
eukprot:m.390341 g.390341  ORF g.390341 m.390341 type:complete len:977 (+) comp20077_c0_seq5:238-3168(+)